MIKPPFVPCDKVHGGEAHGDIWARTIDDGGGTSTAGVMGATGGRVRHLPGSMGDIVALEGGSLVLGSAYVREFTGLGVAHAGGREGRGLVRLRRWIFCIFLRWDETGVDVGNFNLKSESWRLIYCNLKLGASLP